MFFLFISSMFHLNYRKNKNVELFKDIQEKMKLRIERYTLERDALNLRIKECTNFLNLCICETVAECSGDHE